MKKNVLSVNRRLHGLRKHLKSLFIPGKTKIMMLRNIVKTSVIACLSDLAIIKIG
jgi:hypothetical protein